MSEDHICDISPVANLTNLDTLLLSDSDISDISALSGLNNLESLYLANNSISDIEPLVDNVGLSNGDYVWLQDNPLSDTSINTYIPQLEERGVDVGYGEE